MKKVLILLLIALASCAENVKKSDDDVVLERGFSMPRMPNNRMPNIRIPNIRMPNIKMPNIKMPNITTPNI